MKLLFLGALWFGGTALQRCEAFAELPNIAVTALDTGERIGRASLCDRIRHRLRWPADRFAINRRLIDAAHAAAPDVVFIDACRVIEPQTLNDIRSTVGSRLVFYSPDDVSAPHNSSRQLERCDPLWDIFFTTKSFNVPELAARGVRRPELVGNAFDPALHRPLTVNEVGANYESFDVVLVGTCERERMESVNRLAEASFSVVVYGSGWRSEKLHPSVVLRAPALGAEYAKALHAGKVALCPLRKLNRDLVTTRSLEIPAAARPMVAEKTREHDQLFEDGREYVSYVSDSQLVERVGILLRDSGTRNLIAAAGRARCLRCGYSAVNRAREMLTALESTL